ncbi:MAG: T9SS type A sorting domain-containing protein [Bacteroidia bacterium]
MNISKKIVFVLILFVVYLPVTKAAVTITSNCISSSYTVYPGNTAQQVVELKVKSNTSGYFIYSLTINALGSTAITTDASKIHIYYTGTMATFSTATELIAGGSAPALASTVYTATTPYSIATTGTHYYFWIAYDVSASAAGGDVLNAQCTSFNIGTSSPGTSTPTPIPTPTGVLTVAAPPGGVSSPSIWFEANTNVTPATNGSTVTNWNSLTNDILLTQTNTGVGPVYTTNAANFNPAVSYTNNSPVSWYGSSTDVEALDDGSSGADSWTEQEGFVVQQLNPAIEGYVGIVHEWKQDNLDLGREEVFGTGLYSEHEGGNDFSNAAAETYINGVQTLSHAYYWNLCRVTRSAVTTSAGFQIGEQDLGHPGDASNHPRFSWGLIAETVFYPATLTAAQTNKVESYLSVKYGLTLGGNGATTMAYTSPNATTIWAAGTGYHYNVTGIGADVALEGLNQPKSITTGNTISDVISMANSNYAAPVTMADGTYLIWGNNDSALYAGGSKKFSSLWMVPVGTPIYTHGGPSTAIYDQIQRVWRTQKTGAPAGNVIIAVDMSQVMGPGGLGTNANADVVLLVDNNAKFGDGSAGEYTITPNAGYPATSGTIYFSVPYSDFSAVGYFTIGSINQAAAPLPISLLSFTGACNNGVTTLNWSTASETNNHYFTIQSTVDGSNWTNVATIPGAGTTTQTKNYFFTLNETSGTNYYRLSQTDYDGNTVSFNTIDVTCSGNAEKSWVVFPNPTNGQFTLQLNGGMEKDVQSIQIYNVLGQELFSVSADNTVIQAIQNIDLSRFSKGMYFVKVQTLNQVQTKKIIVQ